MARIFFTLLLFFLVFLFSGSASCIFAQSYAQTAPTIITTDIDNFWAAYDKIVTTKDNAEQLKYLNELFIEKASPGQQEMFKARRYKPEEYIDAINKRPEYWARIRPNTLKARDFAPQFESGIEKLRKIYPELRPANIYFTVGVFRSGGTTSGNNILIGSEIIFGDEKLMNNLPLTNVHEYVHTQQKTTLCNNLLGQSVMEGVAEFVSVKAMQTQSTAPAINYGKNNESPVKNAFILQMFNIDRGFWLYSDAKNDFNTRDLGYYVGYAIAEKYYEKAKDKKLAIKEMIELDCNNPVLLAKYVDTSDYFPKSVKNYEKKYEKNRPRVVGIKEFKNGAKNVRPGITRLTVEFSEEMLPPYRSFNNGPLGKETSITIKNYLGFSEDGKLLYLEIEPLEPNKRYQMELGSSFRDKTSVRLKPYLIDITTADK
jgi:hypothetical protein